MCSFHLEDQTLILVRGQSTLQIQSFLLPSQKILQSLFNTLNVDDEMAKILASLYSNQCLKRILPQLVFFSCPCEILDYLVLSCIL